MCFSHRQLCTQVGPQPRRIHVRNRHKYIIQQSSPELVWLCAGFSLLFMGKAVNIYCTVWYMLRFEILIVSSLESTSPLELSLLLNFRWIDTVTKESNKNCGSTFQLQSSSSIYLHMSEYHTSNLLILMIFLYLMSRCTVVDIFIYNGCTAPKTQFMWSQKWNCAASFPFLTFMYLWAIFIFPELVCLFGCSKIGRPVLGIYKSFTDTWMWKLVGRTL